MESDDVSREEGVKGDAPVVRVGSNDDFLQISTCGQNPQTASIPAFVQRGDVWSPLWNPFVPTLILGLMHGLGADAWPASRSGSRRCSFMPATLPPPRPRRRIRGPQRVCRLVLRDLGGSELFTCSVETC